MRISLVTKLCFPKGKKLLLMCGWLTRSVVVCVSSVRHLRNCDTSLVSSVSDAHFRSGFPCKCVPSQFWWVARASCIHRMIVGTMCVDRCFPSGIKLMHTWSVDSLIAGRLVFSACDRLLWLSRRLWIPQVAHSRSPFQIERQFHRERICAPIQVGTFCD